MVGKQTQIQRLDARGTAAMYPCMGGSELAGGRDDSGGFLAPLPPADQAAACQDQAGQASTGDWAGDADLDLSNPCLCVAGGINAVTNYNSTVSRHTSRSSKQPASQIKTICDKQILN
jgi:hypothetical protein